MSIDDSDDDVVLLKRAFSEAVPSVKLVFATSADEALEVLNVAAATGQTPPGLVLLDVHMPRRSGFEMLADLRKRSDVAYVPVVMLSSSARSSDVAAAAELKASSYVVKPNSLAELKRFAQLCAIYWLSLNVAVPAESA